MAFCDWAVTPAKVQPGSVTFLQRFGSAIHLSLHFHCIFLEGVCLDRSEAHLKPRFVRGEPPTDADITTVVQKISRRIIRKLRHLGYLEVGLDAPAATGYDPWRDDALELARTMAASVQQRLAFGERAGERVRRIGASFGADGEVPALTGPRCASVQGFSLHANTHVPAHRRAQLERLIRYTARGRVPGAPDPRRQRRSHLHLYAPVVRWHYRDLALANGTDREAGRPRAPAAYASGALRRLFGAAQSSA